MGKSFPMRGDGGGGYMAGDKYSREAGAEGREVWPEMRLEREVSSGLYPKSRGRTMEGSQAEECQIISGLRKCGLLDVVQLPSCVLFLNHGHMPVM